MIRFLIVKILSLVAVPILASAKELEHPYLFSATKNKNVTYVFGTNHVGIGMADLPDYVLNALKQQKVFMTETLKSDEIEEEEEEEDGGGTDPKTIDNKPFTPSVIQQLENRGMTAKWIQIAQKIPALTCTLYENYEGIRDHLILDEQLEESADREHKIKIALDDAKMMAALNKKNRKACDLEIVVKETPGLEAKKLYDDRLATYRAGDLKDATIDAADDTREVAARNKLWIQKILAQHEKHPFVTMGYGHLGGQTGVLELLRKQGYSITRVSR